MAQLLNAWLQEQAGIRSDDFAKDFASGCLFGKLLHELGYVQDVVSFSSRDAPEDRQRNFALLKPVFTQLGIKLDSRATDALIKEEQHAAQNMVYAIKQAVLRHGSPVQKMKATGALSGAISSVPRIATAKMTGSLSETLGAIKGSTNKATMMNMHLKKFQDEEQRQAQALQKTIDDRKSQLSSSQAAFRMTLIDNMAAKISDKHNKTQQDHTAHAGFIQRKEDGLKAQLQVELALAEKARRRQANQQLHANAEVFNGIENFEVSLKRTGQAAGDEDGPAGGVAPLGVGGTGRAPSAYEHQQRLQQQALEALKQLPDSKDFLHTIQAKHREEAASRREKEAQRRHMLMEQQRLTEVSLDAAESAVLQRTLVRSGAEEERLEERLEQVRQEQAGMEENRALREAQYEERSRQDEEERLQRESELLRSIAASYSSAALMETEQWRAAQAAAEARRAQHVQASCTSVALQLVSIAERVAAHRATWGTAVPKSEWRQWMAGFVAGTVPEAALESAAAPAAVDENTELLQEAQLADYLAGRGVWEGAAEIEQPQLGQLVHDLASQAAVIASDAAGGQQAPAEGTDAPVTRGSDDGTTAQQEAAPPSPLPLRLAVVGGPSSGKTAVAQHLSRAFAVKVLSPEQLLSEAVAAAEQYDGAAAAADDPLQQQPALAAESASPSPVPAASPLRGTPSTGRMMPSVTPPPATPQPATPPPPPTAQGSLTPAADGEDDFAAIAAPPPPPPAKVLLGRQLKALLQQGQAVPDELLVQVVLMGIAEAREYDPAAAAELEASASRPTKGGKGSQGKDATGAGAKSGATAMSPAGKKGAAADAVAPTCQGFVLDGFPRSQTQAALLERALTSLDLEQEAARRQQASLVAPPPADAFPDPDRPLMSGLDAVIVIGMADDTVAIRRAIGRRVDPMTGRIYHLEFDAPPSNCPGLSERLQPMNSDNNDAEQLQQRLMQHSLQVGPLNAWLARFNKLRRPLESCVPLSELLEGASDVATGVVRAKAAAAACMAAATAAQQASEAAQIATQHACSARASAELAARELLTAKRAEIAAAALLSSNAKNQDPAATEVLRSQSAQHCAEQLRLCQAAADEAAKHAGKAKAAADIARNAGARAALGMGDSAVSAEAEAAATRAAEETAVASAAAATAARNADAMQQVAAAAVAAAEKWMTAVEVPADAQIVLTEPAAGDAKGTASSDSGAATPRSAGATAGTLAPQRKPLDQLPPAAVSALQQQWRDLECAYLQGLGMVFGNLSDARHLASARFGRLRSQFHAYLRRQDNKQVLLDAFVARFNGLEMDLRKAKETQAELVLRSDELRDALWEVCDRKMEEAEAERARIAGDSFAADHVGLLAQQYTALTQLELDRFFATAAFVNSCGCGRYGYTPGLPPALTLPACPDVTTGMVPAEFKDRLEGKTAQPPPAFVVPLQAKAPALATALRVAFVAAPAVLATIEQPLEELRRAAAVVSKGAGSAAGGKGKADAVKAPNKARQSMFAKEAAAAAAEEEKQAELALAEAAVGEVLALLTPQLQCLQRRLQLLAEQAAAGVDDLLQAQAATNTLLADCLKERYQAECSAVAALDRVVKTAAVGGTPLPHDLRLQDVDLIVDESRLLLPPEPTSTVPAAAAAAAVAAAGNRQAGHPGQLTMQQLLQVLSSFQAAAAQGLFLPVQDAAAILCTLAASGTFPSAWRSASLPAMQAAVQQFDPHYTQYVDWKLLVASMIIAAYPAIEQTSPGVMAQQAAALAAAGDAGAQPGQLTQQQWESSVMWFEQTRPESLDASDAAPPTTSGGSSSGSSSCSGGAAPHSLKTLLWQLFATADASAAQDGGGGSSSSSSSPALRLDSTTLLLYLCASRNICDGIKKAMGVVTRDPGHRCRATAEQVVRFCYPVGVAAGEPLGKAPVKTSEIEAVVGQIYTSRGGDSQSRATVTAEQLMYAPASERLVNMLLWQYQWRDVYILTRL